MRTRNRVIFGIPSLKSLKHSEDPDIKEFSDKLDILRQLRNDEAHESADASEQEINAAIEIVIDMYLYSVGTNITELESNGYDFQTEIQTSTTEQGDGS